MENNKKKLFCFFKELKNNRKEYLGHPTGKSFENSIAELLQRNGILHIQKNKISKKEKEQLKVISKEEIEIRKNLTNYKSNYLNQPFGSQNYPDFIIFLDSDIYCIEIKFTTKKASKPFWNTGIPRFYGIYIFGSYGLQDLTFFFGSDILTKKEYEILHNFFNDAIYKDYVNKYNAENFENQNRGFGVYMRKAFEQSKKYNKKAHLNYFSHPNRKRCEDLIINFFK